MKIDLFDVNNFNVVEDDDYYYVFRALNVADHNDFKNGLNNGNIRTDRERFESEFGQTKYSEESEISLEEVWDHIKIHYSKETNCISLSTNANVSLDYGGNYFDEYALIRIPKKDMGNYHYAGKYMLDEINKEVEKTLNEEDIPTDIKELIERLNNCNDNNEIINIMRSFSQNSDKDIMSRFQDRQYFNSEQQLEYNKLIAKVTILELSGIRKSILSRSEDNSFLLGTVNSAFTSGELIHYKDIDKSDFIHISKKMLNLLALAQQLKDKNIDGAVELEKRIIYLITNGYNIVEKDGRIVLSNGENDVDCDLSSSNSVIFKDLKMDKELVDIRELYNITSGTIDYQKAKKTIDFCYGLALGKREAYDYSSIIATIMGNDSLTDSVINNTVCVNSSFIDRGNGRGYKLCESVNIGMDSENNSFYSIPEQRKFIDAILGLDIDTIDNLLDNRGLAFRQIIINMLAKNDSESLEKFYAKSIVEGLDYKKLIKMPFIKDSFSDADKNKLIDDLSSCSVSRLYDAFNKVVDSKEDIPYYIINLLLEERYSGYSFKELCELDNLEMFVKDNLHRLNKTINPKTLNRYFNIIDDCNYIPNSHINLRDFQLRIKEEVDDIYSDGRRFAGVVLPTGAGKSFVAMAEMLERKDTNMVYIAPRLEILRQFKKHVVRYIAGVDPNSLNDRQLDVIVRDCFPHLEFYCYQGLNKEDEEKLKKYDADFIILDELHHVGAEKWSPEVRALLNRNKNSKVLGITATPVRDFVGNDKNKSHNDADMMRYMATLLDNYTNEELNEKRYLACDINIIDAIQEGYVVCPEIVSFDYDLANSDIYKNAIQLVTKTKDPKLRSSVSERITEMQKIISMADLRGMDTIIRRYIRDEKGRYILFLPRNNSTDENSKMSTDQYIAQEVEKFKKNLSLVDTDPVISYIHSKRAKEDNSKAIMDFESDDNSDHIKILVAIDMLNEGVHLEGIKGSFNFRKIDNAHQILLLQHLGRTIFALDPNNELDEMDIPVVFDVYNNYSSLNMERIVNKSTSSSDLEKLKDIAFWVKKYGYIPQTDSVNANEKKKAITLRRIQNKYSRYLDQDLDSLDLSVQEKTEIKEILKLGKKLDLWNIEFAKISTEEARSIERVDVFNVSAVQRQLIDICNSITRDVGISNQSKNVRIDNVLAVLDFLSEYNVKLNTETIDSNARLSDLLKLLDVQIREEILYELKKRGIDEEFLLGQEYYFARGELSKSQGYFYKFDSTKENIINFRKYGLYANGDDYKFTNENGFIIRGPRKFLYKNVWSGTYYSQDGYDIQGYDMYGFDIDGINKETHSIYDKHGFDVKHIHKDTGDIYDRHGFDINCIHKDTQTYLNEGRFNIEGYYYTDGGNGNYTKTSRLYDDEGYNIDGINRFGFRRDNINIETGKEYDLFGFGNDGYYWEVLGNKRVKTDKKVNGQNFDRYGNLYEYVDGKPVNMGKVYDNYGFYFDGTHYRTHKKYDERGFDINHNWHPKNEDGTYGPSQGKFDDKGWNIDRLTIRHNVSGATTNEDGSLFLDYVDDHGFDIKGNYHYPCVKELVDDKVVLRPLRLDQDGFVEFYSGTIYYSEKAKTGKNKKYDVHGFNQQGIHRLTGTKLDPYNFDINGFYYKMNEDGEMINTGLLHDERGFTIDKKVVIETENGYEYSKYLNGYDFYRKNRMHSFYDEHGFDADGINYETGTTLDSRNFDIDGYFYDYDENGELVNTGGKYDKDGWDQNKTHISTGRIVDSHGFDYLHMFKNKSGGLDVYDSHGFDYLGVHKTTKTKLNRNNFDIEGYWYIEKDGEMVNSGSKYDDKGLNIDRLNEYDFSKNGNYLGHRRKVNKQGFDAQGIHYITHKNYDLNGRDIDGNEVDLTAEDIKKINYIRDQMRRTYTVLIEDFYEELDDFDKELILAAYDYDLDEFEENDYFTCFINDVKKNCTKSDYSDYTDEEIMEFIKEKSIEKHNQDKRSELDEFFDDYYEQRIVDGDVPYEDYKDSIRFK